MAVIEKIQRLVSEIMIGLLQRGGSRDVAFGHVSAGQINILIRILGTRNDLPTLEVSLFIPFAFLLVPLAMC